VGLCGVDVDGRYNRELSLPRWCRQDDYTLARSIFAVTGYAWLASHSVREQTVGSMPTFFHHSASSPQQEHIVGFRTATEAKEWPTSQRT
jgi:hypothetical protein